MAKRATKPLFPQTAAAVPPSAGARLSDPGIVERVAAYRAVLRSNKGEALSLLQRIGVADSAGRLTKKFGGRF